MNTNKGLNWTSLLFASLALLTGSVFGQHVNESEPRPGETRANRHKFPAVHNAYQRDITLTESLDEYNVSEIELDVRWRTIGGTEEFHVRHFCGFLGLATRGEASLDDYLIEIGATRRIEEGFFFLNIEFSDNDFSCLTDTGFIPKFPANYLSLFKAELVNRIPEDSVYTWGDFEVDQMKWPSIQELLRRGKHVAININKSVGSDTSNKFYFRRAGLGDTSEAQVAFWNTDDEEATIPDQGDRYFSRRYPSITCALEGLVQWNQAYNAGFNFPATNCPGKLNAPEFHLPIPFFIQAEGVGALATERGTRDAPFGGTNEFIDAQEDLRHYNTEVSPSAGVLSMKTGTYDAPAIIDVPMTINARDGTVTIRKEG